MAQHQPPQYYAAQGQPHANQPGAYPPGPYAGQGYAPGPPPGDKPGAYPSGPYAGHGYGPGQPPIQMGPYPSGPYPGQYPQGQPVVVQPVHQPNTNVVVMGTACGQCGGGPVTDGYTACGICLAVCFFPLGIICCLMMKERKCSSCGATY